MANRAARALGLSADQVASVVQMYPANMPMVVARYNPADAQMRIDIFRLDKQGEGPQQRVILYHTTFGPGNGDAWKANRAYIAPGNRTAGNTPGVNPFESFKGTDPNLFYNVSIAGGQVAVGHAMRAVGSPVGMMTVANTRFTQEVKKSGGLFKKKVEVTTYGWAKPAWYLAMPTDLARSTSLNMAAICATNPEATTCPLYATATAGVVFEEFEGGTLSGEEDVWKVDYQSKSGFTFLAWVAIGIGFGFTGLAATAILGLLSGSGGINGVPQGIAPDIMQGSASIEKAKVLGGASIGAAAQTSIDGMFTTMNTVNGKASAVALNTAQRNLNNEVAPRTVSDFTAGNAGSTLSGFKGTVYGNCAPNMPLSTCASSSGFVPRVDQYIEHNSVQFMRDNSGNILRDVSGASMRN